jgi:hypothetical protein
MGGRSRQFPEEKKIEHMYVRVNGLQKELEKLCCFGSLEPEKVVARLGKNKHSSPLMLPFQSPT